MLTAGLSIVQARKFPAGKSIDLVSTTKGELEIRPANLFWRQIHEQDSAMAPWRPADRR